ncbi:BA14K family protein [Martelella alba]|uniref:Lectin-like protein BA14k n=1 Tax=Martelella alba TaxID=2590451 RepID=A0A506UAI6_9HYPH|nr:BA14K family protein [Martelella alba]TPW28817.1 BA14K family protein [Martelella alba]
MPGYVKKAFVGAVSAALVAAATLPVNAMPITAPDHRGAIVKVQGPPPGRGWHGGPPPRGGWHGGPPPRGGWQGGPPPRGGWGPPPGPPPYNGWGWNGNAWAPLAAMGAGALIIGGAIAAGNNNNNNYVSPGSSINPRHYQWCEDRYKSYRASDNTYQPYNGPRQQCYSPYY